MTTPDDLPPIQSEVVDEATLDRLLAELRAKAVILSVTTRATRGQVGAVARATMEEARALLGEGRAVGMQLRYRFEGKHWCDTIQSTPDGFQIVRVEVPAPGEGDAGPDAQSS